MLTQCIVLADDHGVPLEVEDSSASPHDRAMLHFPVLTHFDADTPFLAKMSRAIGHTGAQSCTKCAFTGVSGCRAVRHLGYSKPQNQAVPKKMSEDDPRRLHWTSDCESVYAHDERLLWTEDEMASRAQVAEQITEEARTTHPQTHPPSPHIYAQQSKAANDKHRLLGCTGIPVFAALSYFRCESRTWNGTQMTAVPSSTVHYVPAASQSEPPSELGTHQRQDRPERYTALAIWEPSKFPLRQAETRARPEPIQRYGLVSQTKHNGSAFIDYKTGLCVGGATSSVSLSLTPSSTER